MTAILERRWREKYSPFKSHSRREPSPGGWVGAGKEGAKKKKKKLEKISKSSPGALQQMYTQSGGKGRGRNPEDCSVSKPSPSLQPLDIISVKDVAFVYRGGVSTSRTKQSAKVVGSQRVCCLKRLQVTVNHIYGDRFKS